MICAICGESSHPTKDCPLKHDKKKREESRKRDAAYREFMNELEGNVPTKRKEENKEVEMGVASQVAVSPHMSDDMEIDPPETPVSLQVPQITQISQVPQTLQTPQTPQVSQIPQVLPFLPMMPFLPVPPMTPQQQQTLVQNMRSYRVWK